MIHVPGGQRKEASPTRPMDKLLDSFSLRKPTKKHKDSGPRAFFNEARPKRPSMFARADPQPQKYTNAMTLHKLSPHEISLLTGALCTDSAASEFSSVHQLQRCRRITKDRIAALPPRLLAPKEATIVLGFPLPKIDGVRHPTHLCVLHNRLNKDLIDNIIGSVAHETLRLGKYLELLDMLEALDEGPEDEASINIRLAASALRALRSVSVLWNPEAYADLMHPNLTLYEAHLPALASTLKYSYNPSKRCSACHLSHLGTSHPAVLALRALILSRAKNSRTRPPTARLLLWTESWIRSFGDEPCRQIMEQSARVAEVVQGMQMGLTRQNNAGNESAIDDFLGPPVPSTECRADMHSRKNEGARCIVEDAPSIGKSNTPALNSPSGLLQRRRFERFGARPRDTESTQLRYHCAGQQWKNEAISPCVQHSRSSQLPAGGRWGQATIVSEGTALGVGGGHRRNGLNSMMVDIEECSPYRENEDDDDDGDDNDIEGLLDSAAAGAELDIIDRYLRRTMYDWT